MRIFKIIPVFMLFSIGMLISCKTPESSFFEIGSGGGFTGRYIEYRVYSDGKIFDISNGQGEKLFVTFSNEKIKEIFKSVDKLNIPEIKFIHPGNMTYYIRISRGSNLYEIKWGDHKMPPPQKILDFYNKVWSDIRPK